jgi:hypothetical protein
MDTYIVRWMRLSLTNVMLVWPSDLLYHASPQNFLLGLKFLRIQAFLSHRFFCKIFKGIGNEADFLGFLQKTGST